MDNDPPRPLTPESFTAERWEKEHLSAATKSEEWSKRLLTSLGLANGAGLVAIASALPESGKPESWQIHTAQAFACGMAIAGLSMLCRERFWASKAYRYAWLARDPDRFPDDVKALVAWKNRPWWKKLVFPTGDVEGVDQSHPAMRVYWRGERWDVLGEGLTVASAASFVVALIIALWIRQ